MRGVTVLLVFLNRFLIRNLAPQLLPEGCSKVDDRGLETNNIAEYCALYYGLERFANEIGHKEVVVYQDSQIIVNQVLGKYRCEKSYLSAWLNAIKSIWWSKIDLQWVSRKKIVEVLGH